ncbi:hypothetical protein [Actinoalloteichus caeruleus]|uniref:Uncharacterized protein n=1 Tax=Actinoalloteichus caeruleus DSM 43889 TaxID=1120930 RepID=A0ABT1JHX8_ACTCY|nr:hypothetical protein [Actinoalloteichus caeruleus]MCP2331909.1 hypothetical protein [Actinoalloteichus caeruleus DSM 43889]
MSYRWRYQDATGSEVAGPEMVFGEQEDAEEWFQDEWPALRTAGVASVTLLRDDAEVYGPMSLSPES